MANVPPHGATTGEWAAIASAAILVLGSIGAGIRWLLQWSDGRAGARGSAREAKLERWQADLDRREAGVNGRWDDYREQIEAKLSEMSERVDKRQEENRALRLAFELVAGALRERDPMNHALRRAEQLLQMAFPLDPIVPPAMAVQLGRVDQMIPPKEDRA